MAGSCRRELWRGGSLNVTLLTLEVLDYNAPNGSITTVGSRVWPAAQGPLVAVRACSLIWRQERSALLDGQSCRPGDRLLYTVTGLPTPPRANMTCAPTPERSVSKEVGMTKIHQPEGIHARSARLLPDPGASQGARSATEDAPGSAPPAVPPGSSSEVVPQARRRHFSNADKRRILAAADRCTRPGEIGALMRREGVYSSSLSTWRAPARGGRPGGTDAAKTRAQGGPEPRRRAADRATHARQPATAEQSDKAHLVIEVQKKLALLLGLATPDDKPGST